MSNDAAQDEFEHVLALVQEQMRELTAMEEKRATLTATGTAADGTVEVTVDSQRMVISTVIDESYLEDFELADLGGYVTAAAQGAGVEIDRVAAGLLAPLTQRREELTSVVGSAVDVPDFAEMLSGIRSAGVADVRSVGEGRSGADGQDGPSLTTVRG